MIFIFRCLYKEQFMYCCDFDIIFNHECAGIIPFLEGRGISNISVIYKFLKSTNLYWKITKKQENVTSRLL